MHLPKLSPPAGASFDMGSSTPGLLPRASRSSGRSTHHSSPKAKLPVTLHRIPTYPFPTNRHRRPMFMFPSLQSRQPCPTMAQLQHLRSRLPHRITRRNLHCRASTLGILPTRLPYLVRGASQTPAVLMKRNLWTNFQETSNNNMKILRTLLRCGGACATQT